jgi:hypothetical protein
VKRIALLPLVLAAACSGSSSGSPAAVRSPSAVETSAAPTPSPPPPSPTSAPSPSAAGRRALDGDVDGDGQPDRIGVSGTTLTVTLSGGGRVLSTPVDSDLDSSEPAATAGSTDVDRDGRAEVFVRVAQGASTSTLRMFRYDGKAISPVDSEGGPLLLVVGGSVTHGDGFSCTDKGRLVVMSAESNDGTTFRVRRRTFRFSGGGLVLDLETRATATSMDDPRVRAAYEVDCGPVGEGD